MFSPTAYFVFHQLYAFQSLSTVTHCLHLSKLLSALFTWRIDWKTFYVYLTFNSCIFLQDPNLIRRSITRVVLMSVCRYISGSCHVGRSWLSTHTLQCQIKALPFFFFDMLLWQHRRWYLRVCVNTCTCMCGLGLSSLTDSQLHFFVHSFTTLASRRSRLSHTALTCSE